MSKQFVINEYELLFYSSLDQVEFYEFFGRVAQEVFHTSMAKRPDATNYMKHMACEPLEIKMYELMVTKLSNSVLGVEIEGKEFEKQRTKLDPFEKVKTPELGENEQ